MSRWWIEFVLRKNLFIHAFMACLLIFIFSCDSSEKLSSDLSYSTSAFIRTNKINESSGLVSSRKHPGIFWTHNDSGGRPNLFAIDLKGNLLGEYDVRGAQSIDWEAITLDRQGNILIADVGNNQRMRTDLKILKVPEPQKIGKRGILKVIETIDVRYPEGAYDCEALAVDPKGDLLLITKNPKPPVLYKYDLNGKWVKTQVFDIPGYVTGADVNKRGELVLSTYSGFYIYTQNPAGKYEQSQFVLSEMKQCEAVAWHNQKLVFTNEQRDIYVLDPNRFENKDFFLPTQPTWSSNQKKKTKLLLQNGQKESNINFRWEPFDATHLSLKFELPKAKGRQQQLVVCFSTDADEYNLEVDNSHETVFNLRTVPQEARLILRKGNDKQSQVVLSTKQFEIEKTKSGSKVTIKFEKDFVERQKRFVVFAVGYEKKPSAWPFGFYRVNDKPFMWAKRR